MSNLSYKIITTIVAFLVCFSFTLNANTGQSGATSKIRVYCFYVPKAKENLSPVDQIRAATWERLQPGGKTQVTIDASYRDNVFYLTEDKYNDLFKKCQDFIGENKGAILDLKGTDESYAEFRTSFYRITVNEFRQSPSEQKGEAVLTPIDEKILKELGFNAQDYERLKDLFKDVPKGWFEKIKDKLNNSPIGKTVEGIKELAGNKYAMSALTVASVLASLWFGPSAVAGAVDILYPLVYQALFGIPSAWAPSYWLVYYPGKMHAIAWAYNNSTLVISTTAAMASLLAKGAHGLYRFATGFNKADAKEKLKAIADAPTETLTAGAR